MQPSPFFFLFPSTSLSLHSSLLPHSMPLLSTSLSSPIPLSLSSPLPLPPPVTAELPTFNFIPMDMSVNFPDKVTLECVAVSKPPGKYTWQRVMLYRRMETVVDLVLDERVTLMEGNLTFALTERNDAGIYRCNYRNKHGNNFSDATITVTGEQQDSMVK